MGVRYYYVRESDLNEEALFRELCRQNKVSPSHLIKEMRRKYILSKLEVMQKSREGKVIQKALEDYLTSEKTKFAERDKLRDEEWLRSMKK